MPTLVRTIGGSAAIVSLALNLAFAPANYIILPNDTAPKQQQTEPLETLQAVVTGYSSSEDQTDRTPRVSADGNSVFDGLAACPRRYPFGTIVEIKGVEYQCGDRLHEKYDDRFDIWFMNSSLAESWGKQTLLVEILNIPSLYEQALALDGGIGGECVYFVQYFLRQLEDCRRVDCFTKPFRGDASQIEPNAAEPRIGRIVLLSYKLGHAAVVVDIKDRELVLAESNLKGDGRIIVGRTVSPNDPHIRGYFDFGNSNTFHQRASAN